MCRPRFVATASVHNHLVELRNNGGALLLVSEDLDELVKLADRILVMSGRMIAHETMPSELDPYSRRKLYWWSPRWFPSEEVEH